MSRAEEIEVRLRELETEIASLKKLTRWDWLSLAQHDKTLAHIAAMKAKGIWPNDLAEPEERK